MKGGIFGTFDQVIALTEQNTQALQMRLGTGEYRFRQEDLKRMKDKIKTIKQYLRDSESVLKEFMPIAS